MAPSLVQDGMEEQSWIAASRGGDQAAFVRLVSLHQARVRAFIGAYLRRPDEVDGLAQEVFLAAYFDLAKFRGESSFSSWLLGIARHRVHNRLRQSARETRRLDGLLDQAKLEQLEAESVTDTEQRLMALQSCVQQLPEQSARLIVEHYFEASSVADIARRQGRAQGSLRMALLRIRQVLRACLERKLVEEEA